MDPDVGITRGTIRFAGNYELDARAWELRRSGRAIKLERIPMEILLFLAERRGELVTRGEIVARIWGRDVHLDSDNSINAAVRKLRYALREDPEKPRIIQTVTGKGYRFIAAVADEDGRSPVPTLTSRPGPSLEPAVPVAAVEPPRKPAFRSRWLLLAIAAAVLATAAISFRAAPARTGAVRERVMLAVLPFENLTGDPAQDYFSDGLTEEMISRLGNLEPQRLAVIARTSVMQYKRTPKPLAAISRELRVDYVLEGSVRRDQNKVRISAQLIRVRDGTHVWGRQYDRELAHLLAVQEEIAQAVADQIELKLVGGRTEPSKKTLSTPVAYEAYDLYLKGRYFWNERTREGFEQAVEQFQRAAEKDPTCARAYAGLADCYALMSTYDYGAPRDLFPKARSAALRALDLDGRLAEAHTPLALISAYYDWNWRLAESEFRRAIQLDPNYATVHHWYGEFLAFQGRFDEALAENERARELDPLSLIIANDRGAILYFARQYDRAIEQFRAVLQRDPPFGNANMVLWAYAQKGLLAEAFSHVEKWRRSAEGPWTWAAEASVYTRLGRVADARRAVERLEQWGRDRPGDPMPMLPAAYIAVNEREKALDSLERLFEERSGRVATLKVDPVYDPLREDPRFQSLLRRAGLAE